MRSHVAVVLASLVVACGAFRAADADPSPGPAADAGVDGAGADGAAPSADAGSCAPGHFCDDFERATTEGSTWLTTSSGDASTLDIDTSVASSGSRSLRATALASNVINWRALMRDLGPHARVTVRFSFRRDQGTPSGEIQPLAVVDADARDVFLYVTPSDFGIADYAGGVLDASKPIPLPPVGAWTRFELTVDYGTHAAWLVRDGTEVARITISTAHTQTPNLRLGIHASNAPSKTATFWFDDVDVAVAP